MERKQYVNTSLARALRVLDQLGTKPHEFSLTEIAARLNVRPGSVYSILCTLEDGGYLTRDVATKRYRLGLKLLDLSNSVLESMDIRDIAKPFLQHLASDLCVNAHLAILYGMEVLYLDRKEAATDVVLSQLIGRRVPSHCTALGKVLLAFNPDTRAEVLSSQTLPAITAWTITDPAVLDVELTRVRVQGYALEREEFHEGNACIASPLRDHFGNVIAAISISMTKTRLERESAELLARRVCTAALDISQGLGFSADTTPMH